VIPCSNPRAQYLAYREEIDAAVLGVLDGGWYILGKQVTEFEREFGAFIGVRHGIGVGSGTEALHVALRACGVGAGDEVITVAHTAVATVSAIELAGATPVLVDIDPDLYTLDPSRLERAVTPKTKAIVPVHIYGQAADLTPILELGRRKGIRVIEDCAQAHGAMYRGGRVGSWGDMACFSFYPTKNLGAIGDGGMVVTDDLGLAEQARLFREYGWKERYISSAAGWNSRLDELQAAVLRVKLRDLDAANGRRARIAAMYDTVLDGCDITLPRRGADRDHVYHLYVIRCGERDALQAHLKREGVGALIHYPVPVHRQPAYRDRLRGADGLHETERAAREVLSLPMFPELTDAEAGSVASAVKAFSTGALARG
jgi:dTDP-4-amino-4,6-dideoxygalactose transaminase